MNPFEPMLPFDLVEATEHHGPYITTSFGTTVCDFYTMSKPMEWSTASGGTSKPVPFTDADDNAAFIVRAVNSHQALFDALDHSCVELEEAAKVFAGTGYKGLASILSAAVERNRSSLALAKGA